MSLMSAPTLPASTRGERSVLPMSCYNFAERSERWLLDISTNNVAMRVEKIIVTSRWDFEVEEIVCGGVPWDERPRDVIPAPEREDRRRRGDLDVFWMSKMQEFHPPSPDRGIVPRGSHPLVIVVSSLAAVSREEAVDVSDRVSGSHICAGAIGTAIHAWPSHSDFREADEATQQLFAPATWNASPGDRQRQIAAYLAQIRAGRAAATRVGAQARAIERRPERPSGRSPGLQICVDREFEDWE